MANLAFLDELGHGADRLLDARVGIDAMQVVEIDRFHAKTPQAPLAGLAHIVGLAVEASRQRIICVPNDAELGGDYHLVATPADHFAYQFLIGEGPIGIGRIEQRDAELDRSIDGREQFLSSRLP